MARPQIQVYFKSVATITLNEGITQAQIDQFLANVYAQPTVQTRFQTWRDDFKTAVRFLVGRPAAVNAGAIIERWHFHLETGGVTDEPEA